MSCACTIIGCLTLRRLLPIRNKLPFPEDRDPHASATPRSRKGEMRRSRARCRAPRKGAAAVEFAIVAPIVFLIVLTLIQFAGLLMKQNVLTAAAREGARTASLQSTDSVSSVVSEVHERLSDGGIDPNIVTVNVSPAEFTSLRSGDEVNVSVSGPMGQMAWLDLFVPSDAHLSAEIAYERE